MDNSAGTGRGVRSVELDGQRLPNDAVPLSDDRKTPQGPRGIGLTREQLTMADTPGADDDLDRLPTDKDAGPAAAHHGAVLSARNQPGQRAGPRQDRPEGSGQHRRRRHGAGDDSGRRRARRPLSGNSRPRSPGSDCDTCSNARRVPSRTPPATRASSTISWTSKPVAASGSASFPPSTRRFCSRAR